MLALQSRPVRNLKGSEQLPGKPVACNLGRSFDFGLLWGDEVACHFGPLGFPGMS